MKLTTNTIDVDVREGTVDDVPLLLSFIRAMAVFEKLTATATEASLRDALFGDAPAARVLLLYAGDTAIGYAIYYFAFSTMTGKRSLWLEDVFIDPAYRGKGIGQAMMTFLANVAAQHRCGRLEWIVLDWNASANRFYERLGATILRDWRVCRLDEAQLARVAAERSV